MTPKRMRWAAALLGIALFIWLSWPPRSDVEELKALHRDLRPGGEATITKEKAPGSAGTKESFTYVFNASRPCEAVGADYDVLLRERGFSAVPEVVRQGRRELGWEKGSHFCASLTCPRTDEPGRGFVLYLKWEWIRFPGACP